MGAPDATTGGAGTAPPPARGRGRAHGAPAAAAAVVDRIGWGPLRHVAETGSTNADLVAEARGGLTGPAVLIADHQTQGRGRLDRRWVDVPGASLLVSVRVPVSPDVAALVGPAAALAVRRAVAGVCPGAGVGVKWPNDLVTPDGRKLAGVLAEYVAGAAACVVVGVGVNIAAVGPAPDAVCLGELGVGGDRTAVRDAVAAAFLAELARLVAAGPDPIGVRAGLLAHSATVGRRVRVELPGGSDLVGWAVDLAPDGSLVIDDGMGRHRVTVGDVAHLRALADPGTPAAPSGQVVGR